MSKVWRLAELKNDTSGDPNALRIIKKYCYSNWEAFQDDEGKIYIVGYDVAGFTLEALQARLQSGLWIIVEKSSWATDTRDLESLDNTL